MEYDKKTIDIPEGYEIDFEETKKQKGVVVLRKQFRPTNWAELTRMCKRKESFWYYTPTDEIAKGDFEDCICFGEFEDKETAEAFSALWKLLSYRKAWIGKWKPDWTNSDPKFTIVIKGDRIIAEKNEMISRSMSFPTKEMCDEFYNSFKNLLEIAKPLL